MVDKRSNAMRDTGKNEWLSGLRAERDDLCAVSSAVDRPPKGPPRSEVSIGSRATDSSHRSGLHRLHRSPTTAAASLRNPSRFVFGSRDTWQAAQFALGFRGCWLASAQISGRIACAVGAAEVTRCGTLCHMRPRYMRRESTDVEIC
jgi:hypothetical protein